MARLWTNEEPGVVSFGTDGAYFKKAGMETIVFGPGGMAQMHQPNEYIEAAVKRGCSFLTVSLIVLNRPSEPSAPTPIEVMPRRWRLTAPDCTSGAADMGFGFMAKAGLDHFPRYCDGHALPDCGDGFGLVCPVTRLSETDLRHLLCARLAIWPYIFEAARMDATPAAASAGRGHFGVIIAALLLGEKPSMRQIVGIAISCFGILTIVRAPSLEGQIFGVMLILGGTLAFTRTGSDPSTERCADRISVDSMDGIMAGPQVILAAMLFEGDLVWQISTAPMVAWGAVLCLGLIMTVIGYSAWYFILARYPVPMVMPVLLLPVATILGASAFW